MWAMGVVIYIWAWLWVMGVDVYMGVVMGFNSVYNAIMLFVQLQGAVSLGLGVLTGGRG